jgi:ferredoxin-NADP reductase
VAHQVFVRPLQSLEIPFMSDSTASPVAAAKLSGWLTHLGVSPEAFDDTISLINPLLTVNRLHARVVQRMQETPTALTLVLETGSAFRTPKPGQYVIVSVAIRGSRHRRAYSLRAVAGQPSQIAITVQRQPGGLVSGHLNDAVRVGQIIELEQAAGDFVLPSPLPDQLLLIAGGSGITPGMAMLQHLQASQARTRVTLLYFARSAQDRIFARQLDDLAKTWPQLRYVPLDSVANTAGEPGRIASTSPSAQAVVLDRTLLDAQLPSWAQAEAYVCGPAQLMDAARELWQQAGAQSRLHLEAFAAPKPSGDPNVRHAVRIQRDRTQTQRFEAPGNLTLLVAGEQAGLAIKHGCRQGICHECTCRLEQGAVKDLTNGQILTADGQTIRLCVTSALTDVELQSLN